MVIKVRLKGLKIARNKAGHYFVYIRGTKHAILRNFKGDREALLRRLAEPDMLATYNAHRKRDLNRVYAEGTLGALVAWFKKDCAAYDARPLHQDRLRQGIQLAGERLRLSAGVDNHARTVRSARPMRQGEVAALKMISAMSSVFGYAVEREKMLVNPALGMKKAHKSDPNANSGGFRPRSAGNQDSADAGALRRAARPTIVDVTWRQYLDHPLTGKCFRFIARKTKKTNPQVVIPIMPELQEFLTSLKVRTPDGKIALRGDGSPWGSEVDMQTRVSHWLRDREREGLIGAGTTLHGVRVSYAAWLSRAGASDKEVAHALGDTSERMGKHYTRHVQGEAAVVRAFTKAKDKQ